MLLNDSEQSIDEHMVKFKDRSGMKQYIKSKYWFRCLIKSGYLHQMDIYLGRKQTLEFNLSLGEEVILQLMKDLEQSFCTVYFGSFFNSPKLIEKLFQKDIYGIGTVRADRKQMPKMIDNKQMKAGDCEFLFSGNTMASKRMDNLLVLLLSSALEEMTHLNRKSFVIFYLRITFFDLMDIVYVNGYLIYNMKHPNKFSLLDYKIVIAKELIQYHQGCKRAILMSISSKRKNQPELIDNHGGHLPDYQMMRKQCAYCAMEDQENRTFVICLTCNIPLCLVKEKTCF